MQRANEPEPEEKARRISQITGALNREESLLNELLALGLDLHPVLKKGTSAGQPSSSNNQSPRC